MKEAALTNRIRVACKERGAYVFKARGDPRQTKGIPDLVGCHNGYFFGFEVKVPGREKTLTLNQAENLKRIEEAGGVAAMITSKAQALELLRQMESYHE
jgi:Holliday junction resolvase